MNKIKWFVVIALVAVSLAFVAVPQTKAYAYSSFFSEYQTLSIYSYAAWSFVGVYNFNTGWDSSSNWHYGSYDLSYRLPYGAWFVVMCYSDDDGKFTESLYCNDNLL